MKRGVNRMVYDHPEFQSALTRNDWARSMPSLAWLLGATDTTLFFHADAKVDEKTYRHDVEPYGITMEEITARLEVDEGPPDDVNSRMEYVKKILDKYHWIMTMEEYDKSESRCATCAMIAAFARRLFSLDRQGTGQTVAGADQEERNRWIACLQSGLVRQSCIFRFRIV